MRLFIAVDISERSRKLIDRKIDILKEEFDSELKWVDKDNWHLTIKFLGECSQEKKQMIIANLKSLELKSEIEYIQFDKINAFPNLEEARVIYLETAKGSEFLKELNQIIEREMADLGFEKDGRRFIPHLTLARSRNNGGINIKSNSLQNDFINIFSYTDTLSLYESRLSSDGPEYIQLFSKKLK
ncbi:MAG: RNA 2',3'-cyclic phosphodiesterase [Halanaerobium sp.]